MTDNFLMNRMANCHNQFQGEFKKILCVCSAGLLRSPTAAVVLSQDPFNHNTRAVGCVHEFALIGLDKVHIEWADEIVVMEKNMADSLMQQFPDKNVINLDIPDSYAYRDPELMDLIALKYKELTTQH